jgi:hypothetical protein
MSARHCDFPADCSSFVLSKTPIPDDQLLRRSSIPDFGWDDFRFPATESEDFPELEDMTPPKSPLTVPPLGLAYGLGGLPPNPRALPDGRERPAPATDLNQFHIHDELEILEHRIQSGGDSLHRQPAMAMSISESSKPPMSTILAADKNSHSQIRQEIRGVPAFWVQRPYDGPDDVMDQESSDQLKSEIRSVSRSRLPVRRRRRDSRLKPGSTLADIYRRDGFPIPKITGVFPQRGRSEPAAEEIQVTTHPNPRLENSGLALSEDLEKRRFANSDMLVSISSQFFETDDGDDETDFELF